MFSFIPLPYQLAAKIIFVLIVFAAGLSSGYKLRDITADNEMLTLRNQQLVEVVKQQQEVIQVRQTLQTFANKVEEQNNADKQKRDKEIKHYSDVIKQLGGLYDHAEAVPPIGGGNPASSTPGDTPAPGGTRLSDKAAGFLLEEANAADQVVDQYLGCQQYVKDITGILYQPDGGQHETIPVGGTQQSSMDNARKNGLP